MTKLDSIVDHSGPSKNINIDSAAGTVPSTVSLDMDPKVNINIGSGADTVPSTASSDMDAKANINIATGVGTVPSPDSTDPKVNINPLSIAVEQSKCQYRYR
jgi:hypothetical protein